MPRKVLGPNRGSVTICRMEEQSVLNGVPEDTGTLDSTLFRSQIFPANMAPAFPTHGAKSDVQDPLLKETARSDASDGHLSCSPFDTQVYG